MADDWNTDRPGRIPVLIAAIGFFLMETLAMLVDPSTKSIIRLLLAGALCISAYHGHNWARWVILVLVVLAALFVAHILLTTPTTGPLLLILVAMVLVYFVFTALLFVPSWGGKYFRASSPQLNSLVMERLFIYGSLQPGGPNEHVLADVDGHWEPAFVKGRLVEAGWGASMGYPGLVIDEAGDEIHGHLLSSPGLTALWATLDEFEGEGYERVSARVTLGGGEQVEASVYALRNG